jgi:flavin-dependent dehydrogenase
VVSVNKKQQQYKVLIAGGGPAGIATALTLTARGISNCVIEAQELPTKKLGDALPPNAKPLLKKLGILDLVHSDSHLPYYGNKSCWGSNTLEQKEFIKWIHGHGYLLDRLVFENQLRADLIAKGGEIKLGYKIKKIESIEKGVVAVVQDKEHTFKLTSQYIVDATGRKASICKQLGIKKHDLDTQFALVFSATLSKPLPHQILVEATKDGWWYAAPKKNNELTLMFFTLKEVIPKKELLKTFLKTQLKNSLHLSTLLSQRALDFSALKIMPAGTSRLAVPYGKNWIAVGDAAYSYDPISSYGITSALASGYYAGHALAGSLNNQKDAMQAYHYVLENAFDAYSQNLESHYALEQRWTESLFWG